MEGCNRLGECNLSARHTHGRLTSANVTNASVAQWRLRLSYTEVLPQVRVLSGAPIYMINVERIKERLKEFEKGVTPEMREQWRKEAEEELRQEKLFWESQEIAEEEERKMMGL